ncbi:MAG: FumA C-terminus/TtdB family hydratase beta subunit [Oligosphaeraceae bacterium]
MRCPARKRRPPGRNSPGRPPARLDHMETRSLHTPLREEDVRSLELGQPVLLSGTIYTARDAAHKYLAGGEGPAPLPPGIRLQGGVLYHCGPVMVPAPDGGWTVTAAGPTTSAREEPYQAEVLKRYGVRALIGKGGMGAKTREVLARHGAVYLSAVGGAAQVLAASVVRVVSVSFLEEFGSPEAIWELEVKDFPAIVTMDARGNSLHEEILALSRPSL